MLKKLLLFTLAFATFAICAAGQGNQHSVTLNWQDSLNPAGTTYNVYRAPSNCSGTPAFVKITSALTAKTYLDTTVVTGTYCYAATATLNGVESSLSVPIQATVPAFPPTSLTVSAQ